MHAALVYERNGANWGEPDRLVRAVAAWAGRRPAPLDDPLVRRASRPRTRPRWRSGRLLVYRAATLAATGAMPRSRDRWRKLFVTEAFTRAAADLLDVLGAGRRPAARRAGAPLDGLVEHAYRHSTVTTIYGGTSEVQRGIIAERGLGLPRTR